MLTLATAVLLCLSPPVEGRGQVVSPLTLPTQSSLRFAPELPGEYRVLDSEGLLVGSFSRHADQSAELEDLPRLQLGAGIYAIHDPAGRVHNIVVSGPELVWNGTAIASRDTWILDMAAQAKRERLAALPPMFPRPGAAERARLRRQKIRRTVGASFMSLVLPGWGQIINHQAGKGVALFLASVASGFGALALYKLPNDGTRPLGLEYARLTGFGLLSSALPALWLYSLTDAGTTAAEKTIDPILDHKLRIGLVRSVGVGFRADVDRPGFYSGWSVSLMGQAAEGLHVGVSDLSFKSGSRDGFMVWQFGLRADYRVYERRRLWLDLGVGVSMQIASSEVPGALGPSQAEPEHERQFGATPYAQLNLRYFLLDRLSLDFSPQLSVPVTTRFYSADRALPRYAPILEFGVGTSIYF